MMVFDKKTIFLQFVNIFFAVQRKFEKKKKKKKKKKHFTFRLYTQRTEGKTKHSFHCL